MLEMAEKLKIQETEAVFLSRNRLIAVAKCTHGVYNKAKAPTPVVVNPDGCVDHCHGCDNLCPLFVILQRMDAKKRKRKNRFLLFLFA